MTDYIIVDICSKQVLLVLILFILVGVQIGLQILWTCYKVLSWLQKKIRFSYIYLLYTVHICCILYSIMLIFCKYINLSRYIVIIGDFMP